MTAKPNPASAVNARRRYAERLREFGGAYASPEPGEVCAYCNGRGWSVDHVPPLWIFERMSEDERLACAPRLVRCCAKCNRLLAACISSALEVRRAFVAKVRAAAVPVAAGAIKWPRKPRGPDRKPRALPAPLASVGAWCVRLNGWRNAYVVFRRPSSGGDFERVISVPNRHALLSELFQLDAPSALLDACRALPRLPGKADS